MKQLITLLLLAACLVSIPSYARIERSQAAKDLFKQLHPCPSNGHTSGACPDYVIDHIKPLACGGLDAPSNMQWQTVEEGKEKDKWERKDCQITNQPIAAPSGYIRGPRGGCYKLTASGNKRYVDRALCN
jgi:hypothetical protein